MLENTEPNREELPLIAPSNPGKSISRPALPAPKPVGALRLELVPGARDHDGLPTEATATIHLRSEGQTTTLSGIRLREPHPGWVTVDIPTLETWKTEIERLTPDQRSRIFAPTFFRFLQEELSRRFIALRAEATRR